jgi:lysophospholipase L1-like esterase
VEPPVTTRKGAWLAGIFYTDGILAFHLQRQYYRQYMKINVSVVKNLIVFTAVMAIFWLGYSFLVPDAIPKVLSETSPPQPRPVKIMPLGDSIIAGSEAEFKNGFRPDLLQDLSGYDIDYVGSYKEGLPGLADQDTQAQAGACIRATPCTTSMYEQTYSWVSTYTPDIVIMQGGTNDFSRGRENQDPQIVRNAFRDWIHEVWRAKPDAYIVVIGASNERPTYKNLVSMMVAFEMAMGRPITYVPLDGVEMADVIHPNLIGYKTLADRLAKVLRPVADETAKRAQ